MILRALVIIIVVAGAFLPPRIRIVTGIPKTAICHA
jgi:hypothetical protein